VEAIFTKILNYFPPKCEKVFPLLIDLDIKSFLKREQGKQRGTFMQSVLGTIRYRMRALAGAGIGN
jgi:hypothetical protein